MPESIAFIVHPERKEALREAGRAQAQLQAAGIHVFYPQREEASAHCGLVITFGGDGTLLIGAGWALAYHCPLLGINLGTVGFLTEGDPDRLEEMMEAVLQKRYKTERRSLLKVRVNEEEKEYIALNDAVVTRGGYARLIQVEIRINREHWGTFLADGAIAATPTGSTGYSLSAGGPVVAPGVDCMVITPVCAHSLQHCPCIVSGDTEIRFQLTRERDQRAELQIDGQNKHTLRAGDSVSITVAEEYMQLARLQDYRFFSVLQAKLNEWGQTREDVEP